MFFKVFNYVLWAILLVVFLIVSLPVASSAIGRGGLTGGIEFVVHVNAFLMVASFFLFPSLMMMTIKGHPFAFGFSSKAKGWAILWSLFTGLLFVVHNMARAKQLDFFGWGFLNPMTYIDVIGANVSDWSYSFIFALMFMFIPLFLSLVDSVDLDPKDASVGWAVFPRWMVPFYGFAMFMSFIFAIFWD